MSLPADSIPYWERRRLAYNGVLAVLVLIFWGREIPTTVGMDLVGFIVIVTIFATIANVLYSLVYVAEAAMARTSWHQRWEPLRGVVFLAGTALAAVLAIYVLIGAAPA